MPAMTSAAVVGRRRGSCLCEWRPTLLSRLCGRTPVRLPACPPARLPACPPARRAGRPADRRGRSEKTSRAGSGQGDELPSLRAAALAITNTPAITVARLLLRVRSKQQVIPRSQEQALCCHTLSIDSVWWGAGARAQHRRSCGKDTSEVGNPVQSRKNTHVYVEYDMPARLLALP